jgi:pilus assembly protein Flp/PilA
MISTSLTNGNEAFIPDSQNRASPAEDGMRFTKLWMLLKDEQGATAIEYGLLATLISVGLITAIQSIGTTLNTTFNSVANSL